MRAISQVAGDAWNWARARLRWRDVVIVALIGASMLFTVNYVRDTNREFCQVIGGVAGTPVQAPADPSANPSRVKQFELYEKFVALGQRLGC